MNRLLIYPYYTGDEKLDQVLANPKSLKLLWLEILFNDSIPWKAYFHRSEVKGAYDKACIWYTRFKTMIQAHTSRSPLESQTGPFNQKEYRKFTEALAFVSSLT